MSAAQASDKQPVEKCPVCKNDKHDTIVWYCMG